MALRGRWGEQGGGRQRRTVCTIPVHPSLPAPEDRGSYVSDSHSLCHQHRARGNVLTCSINKQQKTTAALSFVCFTYSFWSAVHSRQLNYNIMITIDLFWRLSLGVAQSGWNSLLETGLWITSAWSRDTTSAITCWRALTSTSASVSQTVATPVSTSTSSPSCRTALVSYFFTTTLLEHKHQCLCHVFKWNNLTHLF